MKKDVDKEVNGIELELDESIDLVYYYLENNIFYVQVSNDSYKKVINGEDISNGIELSYLYNDFDDIQNNTLCVYKEDYFANDENDKALEINILKLVTILENDIEVDGIEYMYKQDQSIFIPRDYLLNKFHSRFYETTLNEFLIDYKNDELSEDTNNYLKSIKFDSSLYVPSNNFFIIDELTGESCLIAYTYNKRKNNAAKLIKMNIKDCLEYMDDNNLTGIIINNKVRIKGLALSIFKYIANMFMEDRINIEDFINFSVLSKKFKNINNIITCLKNNDVYTPLLINSDSEKEMKKIIKKVDEINMNTLVNSDEYKILDKEGFLYIHLDKKEIKERKCLPLKLDYIDILFLMKYYDGLILLPFSDNLVKISNSELIGAEIAE